MSTLVCATQHEQRYHHAGLQRCVEFVLLWVANRGSDAYLGSSTGEVSHLLEEEGLQGVFKRLRRNGHQLEKGLQKAQRGPSLK
jgi:hypothetical protein